MSDARKLEELHPRAPRYSIEFGDSDILRFAARSKGDQPLYTRLLNLSESGIAFLVPTQSAPELGETIKIEFTAPNTQSVACFAKVVRVELHKMYSKDQKPQTFKLVAVQYTQIYPQQTKLISRGLQQKFAEQRRGYQREQRWLKLTWYLKDLLSIFQRKKETPGLQKMED